MYQQMALIRAFEEKLLALKDDGLVNGPVHTSVGQEAVAVGAALALRPARQVAGTHRAHHQYLAKALSAAAPAGYDPLRDGLTDEMQAHVLTLLKEIMGLAGGCSGGRGGSMHLYNPAIGVAGTNAIVGGGVPPATGVAWADRMQGRDAVTVCFFGDGAVYQGAVHEACNLAALWEAPIIYAIENNHFAVATSRDEGCSARSLSHVAAAYGMPGFQVDGMDPVGVKLAVEHILADRGNLPCLLEIETWRHYHHAGCIAGSAFGYRSKEEEAEWRARDPLAQFEARLRAPEGSPPRRSTSSGPRRGPRSMPRPPRCSTAGADGAAVIREELWPTAESAPRGLRDEDLGGAGPFVEATDGDVRARDQVPRRHCRSHRALAGAGPRRGGPGRGGLQHGRRRLRGDQGTVQDLPGPRTQHAHHRGRLLRARLRGGHERDAPGGGADVLQLRPRGRRPALQPDRSAGPHLRREGLRAAGLPDAGIAPAWATGRSTAWTPCRCSRCFRDGGSWCRRRRSTTSACSTPR